MKRILVVEDKATSRELLRAVLERQGYLVLEAANGQEGLQRIQQESPDLVLLDLQIPAPNGYEVLKQIRGDRRLPAFQSGALPPTPLQEHPKKRHPPGSPAYIAI